MGCTGYDDPQMFSMMAYCNQNSQDAKKGISRQLDTDGTGCVVPALESRGHADFQVLSAYIFEANLRQ